MVNLEYMNTFSISKEILKSARWNIIVTVVNYIALFMSMIVLARWIAPADFGIAALASSSIVLFSLLSQFGFAQAIIGLETINKEITDSVFTFSLIIAAVLYVILFLVSPIVASFYHKPLLQKLLLVNGLGLFITLGTAIPTALLQRSLNYKAYSFVQITISLLNSLLAIVFAIRGYGVWAFIIPTLIALSAGGIVAFHFSSYRPALSFKIEALKKTANFGLSALVSNLANYFCNNSVILVMGKVWAVETLGYYSFAYSKQSRAIDFIGAQITSSLFPILSKVSEKEKIKKVILQIITLSILSIVPVYMLLALGAPVLFPIVFGLQWNRAIVPFQLFCLLQIVRTFGLPSNSVLYALRLPHVSAKIVMIRLFGYLLVVTVGYVYKLELITIVNGILLVDIPVIIVYLTAMIKAIDCSFAEYCSFLKKPLRVIVLTLLALIGSVFIFNNLVRHEIIRFGIASVISIFLYIVIMRNDYLSEWRSFRLQHK